MKNTIFQSLLKQIFRFSLAMGAFLALGSLSAFAASIYQVAPTTGTVGTAVSTFESEYTVDTALQTWANADTLTLVAPDNFPGWDAVTFTAEYDADVTNNANETVLVAGAGNGQYAVGGTGNRTLTIKWDLTGWGAVGNGTSTIRVLATAGNAPTYFDDTSTFTFGGTTAAVDTNPSGTADINVSAADAAASIALSTNSVVGAAGNTTLTLTIASALTNTDTVVFTMPANLDVSAVAFGSETFAGAGTISTCTAAGQIITCTANGAITAGTGTIVMSGIVSAYAATGQTVTSLAVNDVDAAGADISSDASGTVTDTTASDAGATITLASGTVGATQNTTLAFALGYAMANTDTVVFTMPDNLDVSGVTFLSETFAGGGTISGCAAVAQVVTCTANGAITAGSGAIVMSGITGKYTATGQTVTSLAVNDTSAAGADISSDATGTATDTTASDAAMSVTLGTNSVVGESGNTTLSFTLGYAMANTDTVIFTLPQNLELQSLAYGSDTFGGAGAFTCTRADLVVTCTATGAITAGAGTIVMSGIKAKNAATGQTVITMAVNDTSASGADISSDTTGTVTNTTSNVGDSGNGGNTDNTTTTGTTTTTDTTTDTGTTTGEETTTDEGETAEPVVITTSSGEEVTLEDIGNHWAEIQITAMTTEGIVKGNADGTFKPDANLNRAEAATLLYRILGLPEPPAAPDMAPFSDVSVSDWFAGYVKALKDSEFVGGYPDGTYKPGSNINRAEFLTLAMNVYYSLADDATKANIDALKTGAMTDFYSDLDISAWYASTVTAATELGFIQGSVCGDGRCFRAGNDITRAEATTILYNMFKVMLGI
ncbi:MAG: S-layer homology domain-containing protein [Ilumatobacteraceae bacterium]